MAAFVIAHSLQAALSAYALYHSYIAINKLREYEDISEKVSKFSSTAKHQLHKTRTTQASAAFAVSDRMLQCPKEYLGFCRSQLLLSHIPYQSRPDLKLTISSQILLSLLTSVSLTILSRSPGQRLLLNLVSVAATVAARVHVTNFWQSKSKVPLADGFNEGVEHSKAIIWLLDRIALGWIVTTVLALWALF